MCALKTKDIVALKTKDTVKVGIKTGKYIGGKSIKVTVHEVDEVSINNGKETKETDIDIPDTSSTQRYVESQSKKIKNYGSAKREEIEKRLFPKMQEKPIETKDVISPLKSRRNLHRQATNQEIRQAKKEIKEIMTKPAKQAVMKNKVISKALSKGKTITSKVAAKAADKASVKVLTTTARVVRSVLGTVVTATSSILSVLALIPALVIIVALITVLGLFSTETASEGMFISPYGDEPYSITSEYGARIDPITGEESYHDGWDVASASGEGTPIYAVFDGQINSTVTSEYGYGNYVVLKVDCAENMTVMYAHLKDYVVSRGDEVVQGQLIGFEGNTGRSTGSHLHFEVRIDDEPVNGMFFWKLVDGAINGDVYGN